MLFFYSNIKIIASDRSWQALVLMELEEKGSSEVVLLAIVVVDSVVATPVEEPVVPLVVLPVTDPVVVAPAPGMYVTGTPTK